MCRGLRLILLPLQTGDCRVCQYFTRWNIIISIIFSALLFCQMHNTHVVVCYLYCTVTGESLIQLQPTRHLVFFLPAAPPARITQSTSGSDCPIFNYKLQLVLFVYLVLCSSVYLVQSKLSINLSPPPPTPWLPSTNYLSQSRYI